MNQEKSTVRELEKAKTGRYYQYGGRKKSERLILLKLYQDITKKYHKNVLLEYLNSSLNNKQTLK